MPVSHMNLSTSICMNMCIYRYVVFFAHSQVTLISFRTCPMYTWLCWMFAGICIKPIIFGIYTILCCQHAIHLSHTATHMSVYMYVCTYYDSIAPTTCGLNEHNAIVVVQLLHMHTFESLLPPHHGSWPAHSWLKPPFMIMSFFTGLISPWGEKGDGLSIYLIVQLFLLFIMQVCAAPWLFATCPNSYGEILSVHGKTFVQARNGPSLMCLTFLSFTARPLVSLVYFHSLGKENLVSVIQCLCLHVRVGASFLFYWNLATLFCIFIGLVPFFPLNVLPKHTFACKILTYFCVRAHVCTHVPKLCCGLVFCAQKYTCFFPVLFFKYNVSSLPAKMSNSHAAFAPHPTRAAFTPTSGYTHAEMCAIQNRYG